MSEELQTYEETINAFYPTDESEPLETPTDEAETDEEPVESDGEAAKEEAEEEADEDEPEDDEADENGDILVYEINGKEYTAKDIKLLETNDKLRQADYTRKTQALAEERKQVTAQLSDAIAKTNDLAAQLEVLVAEDGEIDWAELKEYEPDEYIKLKERADTRKAKLEAIKANNSVNPSSNFSPDAERVKLVEAYPEWVVDGKPTKAYQDDMTLLSNYYVENGINKDEAKLISQSAKVVQMVLSEAKRKAETKSKEEKSATTKKKIISSPKVSRPKAQTTGLTAEEIFYGTN